MGNFPVTFIRNFQLNLKTKKNQVTWPTQNFAAPTPPSSFTTAMSKSTPITLTKLSRPLASPSNHSGQVFASALTGVDVAGLITNIGSGVGSAPAGGAAAGGAAADAAPAEEAKKEQSEEEESDSEMGC